MSDVQDKSGYQDEDETQASETRSCVSCKHHRAGPDGEHRCARPQLGVTRDYVLGEDIPNSVDAYHERTEPRPSPSSEHHERCGRSGKFWQPSGF